MILNVSFLLAPIPFTIFAFCSLHDVYTVMSIEICVLMLGINVVANSNLSQGFWLLLAMYRRHRLEFYNHRKRLIALLLTTSASLFLLFAFAIMGFYLTFCEAEINELHTNPDDDTKLAFTGKGICNWYTAGFENVLMSPESKKKISLMFFGTITVELVPFLAFFLLDQPHDCFVCLGKDPDRIYSSLQLTKA